MRLVSLTYNEFAGEADAWSVEGLTLGPVNLIVGPNAVGKSRTISIIKNLGWLVCGKHKELFYSGHFTASFEHDGSPLVYELLLKHRKVEKENYNIAGQDKLARSRGGMGKIYAEDLGEGRGGPLKFQTPDDKLAVVARRDSVQHSFLQGLHDWGSSIRYFDFGSFMGSNKLMLLVKGDSEATPHDDSDAEQVAMTCKQGLDRFHKDFVEGIKNDMGAIGYEIDDVTVRHPDRVQAAVPGDLLGVAVKEHDLGSWTDHNEMSRGMFRALSIIIHLTYAKLSNSLRCVLIDDIGEGLDFSRSCALIDLLRQKAIAADFQLIMSTNDRFVMNKVPLEEWCFLQRTAHVIQVRNYANSRETFERFKITGLSNFDLLTTDFMAEVSLDG